MKGCALSRCVLAGGLILIGCGSSSAGHGGTGGAGPGGSGGAAASQTGGAGGAVATGGSAGTKGGGGTPGTGGSSGTGGTVATGGASGAGGAGGKTAGVWRPFDDASPWNTPIPANPTIDPNSAAMITDFATMTGQGQFWINFADPIYFVDSTATPLVTVMAGLGGTGFRTGAASDAVSGGSGTAPIPAGAVLDTSSDHPFAAVDRLAAKEWGFWELANTSGGWTAGEASTLDLSGDGVRPPERNNPWWAGHGPRACGFGLIAGLIKTDEVKAGSIEHALIVAYPHIRSSYYTPPASSGQGTTSDAQPTRGILCGGHIQLDPSLDVTTLGLNPAALAIARALQKYGAFIGDYSGATALFADSSPDAMTYWQSGVLGSLDAQKIPLSRFRVLQIGTTYDNGN